MAGRKVSSPDGTRIAVGSGDGTIKVWKLDGDSALFALAKR